MLFAIIKKELLHHLVSFRFAVFSGIMVLLAGLAIWIGTVDYRLRLASYQNQVARHGADLEKVHVYSYLQPIVARPPAPLSIFDRGFDSRLGNRIEIYLFAIPDEAIGTYHGNDYMASFQALDLTLVIGSLLGLLALLLTFDSIVGERDQQNLALVFSNSLPRTTWLIGKNCGALLTLLIPLGMSLGIGLLALSYYQIDLDLDQWLRLVGLFATYVVYLSLMTWLGITISVISRKTSSALVLSIFAWLVLILLIPKTTAALGKALVGDDDDQRAVIEEVKGLHQQREQHLESIRRQFPLLDKLGGHRPVVFENGWNRAVLYRYGSASYYRQLSEYHRQEVELGLLYAEKTFAARSASAAGSERSWVDRLSSVSPAVLLQRLAETLTATSIADHEHFIAASRDYREHFIEYLRHLKAFESWRWFTDDPPQTHPWPALFGLTPDAVDENNLGPLLQRLQDSETAQRLRQELDLIDQDPARFLTLDSMPGFEHHALSWSLALRHAAFDGVLLLLVNALFVSFALIRFRRFRLCD